MAFFFQIFDTTHTGITTNETCHACFALFDPARVAMKHLTASDMRKRAGFACSTFFANSVNPTVCRGLIDQYLDPVGVILITICLLLDEIFVSITVCMRLILRLDRLLKCEVELSPMFKSPVRTSKTVPKSKNCCLPPLSTI